MRTQLDLQQIAYITTALADYKDLIAKLAYYSSFGETAKSFGTDFIKKCDAEHINQYVMERWNDINLYHIKQMWGSTACGWGGMGGAAMTESYTCIIECVSAGCISVYYSGRLAYVAKIDEKLEQYKGYKNLPGLTKVEDKLTIIYKHK